MPRWEPGSQERLQKAALELFSERGYDTTTVAAIAERAGVTKRTFFRHFVDKRGVLFAGAADLQALLVNEIDRAPDDLAPLEAIAAAIVAVDWQGMAPRRYLLQRQTAIAATPELMERDLIKLDSLALAFAEALRRRGLDDSAARLTAQAGMTIFRTSYERFLDCDSEDDMPKIVDEVLAGLRATVAA